MVLGYTILYSAQTLCLMLNLMSVLTPTLMFTTIILPCLYTSYETITASTLTIMVLHGVHLKLITLMGTLVKQALRAPHLTLLITMVLTLSLIHI